MKYLSEKVPDNKRKLSAERYMLNAERAFSLIEVITALAILALTISSVLTVYNRCMASAADSIQRHQAFTVARENMETLLSKDSVQETVEYGSSDKYPQIQWNTVVESFYEPVTMRVWMGAVCSAEYTDTAGQPQTVELTHWLTDLTKEQLLQIIDEKQKEKERLGEDSEQDETETGDDESEPGDEQRWCGKTFNEIMFEMPFDELWVWDCPEFWNWLAGG